MERVKEVNSNDYYLYQVKKVIVFGSYLSTKERLGDIDIAIELVPKEGEPKRYGKLTRERAREARDKGRTFSSFIDELYWARTEVKRFLKSRSRSISLHETDDPILEQVAYQVIYEA